MILNQVLMLILVNNKWSDLTYNTINITFAKGLELRYTTNGKNWTVLPLNYVLILILIDI